MLGAVAEALDHPAADGERCEHRDLLGRDRADERLERIRRERRPEAGQLARQPREHGIRLREVVEGVKVERRAEQSEHDGRIAVRERLDQHASRRRLDPQLPALDHAVQAALVPQVRAVDAEGAKPLRGHLEVVWLRQFQQGHAENLQVLSRSPYESEEDEVKRIIAVCFAGLLLFAGAASAATPAQRIASLEKQVKSLTATVKKQQAVINCIAKSNNKCVTLKSTVNTIGERRRRLARDRVLHHRRNGGRAAEHVDDAGSGESHHAVRLAADDQRRGRVQRAPDSPPGHHPAAHHVGVQRARRAREPHEGVQARVGASAAAMSKKSRKGS